MSPLVWIACFTYSVTWCGPGTAAFTVAGCTHDTDAQSTQQSRQCWRPCVPHVRTPDFLVHWSIAVAASDIQNQTRALFCRIRLQTGHALRHQASDWLLSEALSGGNNPDLYETDLSGCGLRLIWETEDRNEKSLQVSVHCLHERPPSHERGSSTSAKWISYRAGVNKSRSARPSSLHHNRQQNYKHHKWCVQFFRLHIHHLHQK